MRGSFYKRYMLPERCEYYNGNNTLCIIGDYEEATDTFIPQIYHAIDHGIDFYAPETTEGPDGRRIMIGWMQNWDIATGHDSHAPYFGQMSLPRELKIVDNRLYQLPLKELEARRRNCVEYTDVLLGEEAGEIVLKGIEGRQVMSTTISTKLDADGICFTCSGKARMNISKYELVELES